MIDQLDIVGAVVNVNIFFFSQTDHQHLLCVFIGQEGTSDLFGLLLVSLPMLLVNDEVFFGGG